jgi:DNA-binding CsgD family transcriptional regulator
VIRPWGQAENAATRWSGVSGLDGETAHSAADEEPAPEDPDPLRASLALAQQTTAEWLISRCTSRSLASDQAVLAMGALGPGTTVKILYHADAARDDLAGVDEVPRMRAPVHIRATLSWLPEMVISDRASAIVFTNSEDPDTRLVKTDHPEAIFVLAALFDQAWNAAAPVPPDSEHSSVGRHRDLADVEHQLLELLAYGATDETAARLLGVSLRTARRQMAALMSRLAAKSRFQAGVEAVKRGWVR